MLLFDEKHKQLNVEDLKAQLKNFKSAPKLGSKELEEELGKYYNHALQLEGSRYGFEAKFLGITIPGIGKILEAIKKFICGIVTNTSTEDEIIDAILTAIASIIPGGVILKPIVEKLIKYILSEGVTAFCAV